MRRAGSREPRCCAPWHEVNPRDQARVCDLGLRLRTHFEAAVKRGFNPPDEVACYTVATTLAGIEISLWKQRRPSERSQIRAVKLLRHTVEAVAAVRNGFERAAEYWDSEEFRDRVRAIENWRCVSEDLIPGLLGDPRDPIIVIAEAAREAWASANLGKFPKGRGRKLPVAKFVVAALAEIDITKEPRTVESVLRGERRKHAK